MGDVKGSDLKHELGSLSKDLEHEIGSDVKLTTKFQKLSGLLHECHQCGYAVTRKEILKRHIAYEHEGAEWKYKCDKCNERFKDREALNIHIRLDHEKSAFKCEEEGCDAKYLSRCGLRDHKYKVHQGRQVSCTKCDYVSYNQYNVNQHFKRVHLHIMPKCDQCDFSSKCKQSLSAHKQEVHNVLPKNKKPNNRRRSDLLGDRKTSFPPITTELKCDLCGYRAPNNHMFFLHKDGKHGEKKKCKQCDKSFKYTTDLKEHIKVIHEGIKKVCPHCDFKADFNSGLRRHMKSNHGISNLKCDICNELFLENGRLNVHKSVVHEGKILECEQCDYTYTSFDAIKTHIIIKHRNTGAKRLSCKSKRKRQKEKNLKFLTNGEMKIDLNMNEEKMKESYHEVDLRYACPYCGEEFTSTEEMGSHIASHI